MRYVLGIIMVFVLSTVVYAQSHQHRHMMTPTPQMRLDQIERQGHMNRAIPHNWIDHPPYRYQHQYQYQYPPIYMPYQYQPYFYNPYRGFNYGYSIYGGNGIYFSYSFR